MKLINEIKDLGYEERIKLKDKLMECAICNGQGIRQNISLNDLKAIITGEVAGGLSKTRSGYFWEKEGDPEWVCPRCYKREKARVTYWNELNQLTGMQDKMMDEIGKKRDAIIKKSMFVERLCEEYEIVLQFTKNKKEFAISIYEGGIGWSYSKNDPKSYLTPKVIKEIEEEAKTVIAKMSKVDSQIKKKWHKKMGVIPFEYGEGTITYMKEFKRFPRDREYDSALLTINYWPEFSEDRDYDAAEKIIQKHNMKIGNKIFEVFIIDNKSIYECIWEITIKKERGFDVTEKRLVSNSILYPNIITPFKTITKLNEQINKLRQLVTEEEFEIDKISFASKELRISKKDVEIQDQERQTIDDLIKCDMQIIDMYRSTLPNNTKELGLRELNMLINLMKKEIKWIEVIHPRKAILSKINKVGDNSRHLVLDKSQLLKKFLGCYTDVDILPNEIEVKVEYDLGRIVITKKDYGDTIAIEDLINS